MDMDLTSVTLAGLVALGVPNVVLFFYPNLDSKVKFALSFLAALAVIVLVPVGLGVIWLEYVKQALVIAFAGSGAYKLFTKAGGN